MTSKDFEKIAAVIDTNRLAAVDADSLDGVNYVYATALDLVDVFRTDNPRFQTDTFLRACGF